MEYVIGVDSGGTHIVAQALSQDGKIMEQSESGPGNILLNPEQTIQNLKDVIESLFLKQKRIDCKYILIGIAGIETTGNSSEISQLLTDYFKVTTYVISDAKLALLNGLEGKDGTLIISGTGSVVYVDKIKRCFVMADGVTSLAIQVVHIKLFQLRCN